MSKYSSSQLVGRDGNWKSSNGSLGGAQVGNLNNNATSNNGQSSSDPTSLPPERPPKKPHLRQFNPQQVRFLLFFM